MSEYTEKDMRKARDAKGLPRWKLGEMVGVSESTVERWESGETVPTPEDVDRIGEALGEPTMWHKWMLSHYDSYRRRYIGCTDLALPVSVMRNRYMMEDVARIQGQVERDVMDGKLDDEALATQYTESLKKLIASLSDTLARIGSGGANGKPK